VKETAVGDRKEIGKGSCREWWRRHQMDFMSRYTNVPRN